MRTLDRGGSTENGTPMVIIAILGAIALPRFWPMLPTWVRVLSVAGLAAMAIGGIVLAMQPTGMASRMSARELEALRERARSDSEGPQDGSEEADR